MADKLIMRKKRYVSRLSVSIDEELSEKFKEVCSNNFYNDNIQEVFLGSIKIVGSGTTNRGAKYSDVMKKLIIQFIKDLEPEFIQTYYNQDKNRR